MAPWQDFLRNNSQAMTQTGLGLLSGKTGPEQAAMGAQGLMQAQQQNKTLKFLEQQNPELAQAVKAGGISAQDAVGMMWKQKLEAQKPKTYDFQVLPDGTYGTFDQEAGQFSPLGQAPRETKQDDYTIRQQQAQQLGMGPDDPRYQNFVLTGKMPREDTQALTATDKKALWSAEDEIPMLDNTLASLKQARDLNRKTYSGTGAGLLGTIGTNVPGAGMVLDREKAVATSEFNKLMSMEAIQSMAQSLKGATTDAELARFVDILADPSTDPDIRERTIDRMVSLAERVKEVKASRINELRGLSTPAGSMKGNRTTSGVNWSVEP